MTISRTFPIISFRNLTVAGLIAVALLFPISTLAQRVTGRVVEQSGEAVAYANVVVLSERDSVFLGGATTGEDGVFTLDSLHSGNILKTSCVGFQTCYQTYKDENSISVVLEKESYALNEVVVKSKMPQTVLKPGGMVTHVAGTVLEKVVDIEQLLDRIPTVTARNGAVSVIGRGTPLIYINGRKMQNQMELERLRPDQIKTVEVVHSPGARYGQSVSSIIRITTKKPVGEGWGMETRTGAGINGYKQVGASETLQLSYRKGKLDMYGMFSAMTKKIPDDKFIRRTTYVQDTWEQTNDIRQDYSNANLSPHLSATYLVNDSNSVGASVNYNRLARLKSDGTFITNTMCNGITTDVTSSRYGTDGDGNNVSANIYYVGKLGKLGVDFNADYGWGESRVGMNTVEQSLLLDQDTQASEVNTEQKVRTRLFASKLMLSLPLFSGELSFGGEFSTSRRKATYNVLPTDVVDDDNSKTKENMLCGFLEYTRTFGRLNLQAGLRYEYVNFKYYVDGEYVAEQSRNYGNWFPFASLSWPVGKTMMQLAYSFNINRPSYQSLRSNLQYDNRYTYETGNPFLVSSISRMLNYSFAWKWLYANILYSHNSDPIGTLSLNYNDNPQISLMRPDNLESYDNIMSYLSLRPVIGIWHPSLGVSFAKQWFKMETHDGKPLRTPVFGINFNNTFDTKWCTISFGMTASTKGHQSNSYAKKGMFTSDLLIYKNLCQRRLQIQLYISDIFATYNGHSETYSGKLSTMYFETYACGSINLSVRYHLNLANRNYKGKGAGQAQKSRM